MQVGPVDSSLLHRLLSFVGDQPSWETAEFQKALLALRTPAVGTDADEWPSHNQLDALPLGLAPVVLTEAAAHTLASLPVAMAPGEGAAALMARLSNATNVAAVLEELGYACAATKEQVRHRRADSGSRLVEELTLAVSPNPSTAVQARAEGCTYAAQVWALSAVQGPFPSRPVPNPNRPIHHKQIING